MRIALLLSIVALSTACSSGTEDAEIRKTIKPENFPGLKNIGTNISEVELDYDLDSPNGSLVHFESCSDVRNTEERSIREDQFQLLSMLKLNCDALDLYFKAKNSSVTLLPKRLSPEFIRMLPATSTPSLGGDNLKKSEGDISKAYPKLTTEEIDPTVVQAELNDLTVNFTELARGDFDNDGKEDILLRLDWSNRTSFGKGFELKLITMDKEKARVIDEHK